ncbi:MAG: AlkA N-terminal domain-containing protein [Acidimicrobiales bacterium]
MAAPAPPLSSESSLSCIASGANIPAPGGEVRLASRGPALARPLIEFLAARAIPGLEEAEGGSFRRNLAGGGWLELRPAPDPEARWLDLRLHRAGTGPAGSSGGTGTSANDDDVVRIVRRVADLDTDLAPVSAHLASDPELAERLAAVGPARLPGTFDPFELAVRAVAGQQVTVAAARTLLGRLVALVATGGEAGPADVVVVPAFPTAAAVAEAPLDGLGMPASRRASIRELARAVADGRVALDPDADPDQLTRQLVALPGIGPWTAGYVTMRVVAHGDGWPAGDLVLRQSLGLPAADLERRAQAWRPWRSYAALLLWRTAPPPLPRTRKSTAPRPDGTPRP